jgi:predicted dehydrogenase
VAAVKASGTWHMVGYHKRSDPATMAAKAEIDRLKDSGELGKMTYVRILMPAGDWVAGGFNDLIRVEGAYPEVARDPAPPDMDAATYKRYIAFVNYYIHQVNLMRYLLGEDYDIDYVDPAGRLMVARGASGIPAVLEMATYHTSIDWNERAEVYFERGYVKLSLPAPLAHNRPGQIEVFRDPGAGQQPQTLVPTLPWKHAMLAQAENFVNVCRGQVAPPCDAAEAVKDLRIAREYIRMLHGA